SMLPSLDYAGLSNGATEMKEMATNCSYLFTIELWFTIFDGCGELTNTHIHGQNLGILPFQACLFLNGYVHVPFAIFVKQLAFSKFMFQDWFLLVWELDWNPNTLWADGDSNPPF